MKTFLLSLYYEFLSEFVVKKVRYKVTGECNKCGKCCQEIRMKGADNEKDFKLTQFFIPMYRRFVIKGKDENGDLILGCTLQNPDGTCSVYNKRPKLCKNYPGKYLYFQGVLPEGCGFKIEPEKSFDDYLKQKMFRK